MTVAANLPSAAALAWGNLYVKWQSNLLKSSMTAFWQACIGQFPEELDGSHPVSNWLTIISALADRLPATGVSYQDLIESVDTVYRVCWMTSQLLTQGIITPTQATTGPSSVLVAYNAQFA